MIWFLGLWGCLEIGSWKELLYGVLVFVDGVWRVCCLVVGFLLGLELGSFELGFWKYHC